MLSDEKILYELGRDVVFTTHRIIQGGSRSVRLEEVRSVTVKLGSHAWLAVLAVLLFGGGLAAGVPGLLRWRLPGTVDLSTAGLIGGIALLALWAVLRPRIVTLASGRDRIVFRTHSKRQADRLRAAIESARSLRVLSLIRTGRLAEAAHAVHAKRLAS